MCGFVRGTVRSFSEKKSCPCRARGLRESGCNTERRWDHGHNRKPKCRNHEARMNKPASSEGQSASELIDQRIVELGGWRAATLSTMRKLIKEADPDVVEEWKWDGPVWSHGAIICTGESYKAKVKLTFAKGAAL